MRRWTRRCRATWRAGDYAAQVAARLVAAVFVVHPLVHVLVRGLALDRERLADASVLAARPGAGRSYGSLLVSFSQHPTPRLALGAPGASPLLHRLTAMTHLVSPDRLRDARRSGRLLGVAALTAVALAGFAATAEAPSGTRAFQMIDPTIAVDGVTVDQSVSRVSADDFRFFEVTLLEYGRFVVSDAPFEGAARAGTFEGNRLDVSANGHTLAARAGAPLFPGDAAVPAYARFDAYEGPPAPLAGLFAIVGVTHTLDGLGPVLSREASDRRFREAMARQLEREAAGEFPTTGTAFGTTAAGDTVFDFVGEMPEIVGGMDALATRLVYPDEAKAAGVEGRAILRFDVGTDGTTTRIEVAQSSGDARLDSAAVEAVRAQPFVPGRQDGRAVAVRFTLPVAFRLPSGDE